MAAMTDDELQAIRDYVAAHQAARGNARRDTEIFLAVKAGRMLAEIDRLREENRQLQLRLDEPCDY